MTQYSRDAQPPVGGSPSSVSFATAKPTFGVRIADVAALKADESKVIGQRKIPTLPVFDQAFASFAQGTVFKARNGFVAVEDLQPGDWLATSRGDFEQVTWIGSAVFASTDPGERVPIIRIMGDSFGMSRPESFISVGPGARLLQTPPDLRGSSVASRMMTPSSRFIDGVNVIEIFPPTPIRLFHVGLRRHAALIANGLEVESYHPGQNPVTHMSQTLQNAFISLFPHVDALSELGPMRFARAPEDQEIAEAY